jgi:ketosteroid isomerase-like protein
VAAKKKVVKKKVVKKKVARKVVKKAASQGPSAADAIHRLDGEFMRTAAAKDSGALVKAFYASEAVLMPPNHPAVEGRDNIRAFLQGLMDSGFTSLKLETTTTASAGDLAYGRGRYVLSMSPPGTAPFQETGKYVVVYRRQGGAWRAVTDMFSSDEPARPSP